MIGIPDLADSQQAHIQGYVRDIAELRTTGFGNVYLCAVASSEDLGTFLSKSGADASGICAVADSHGAFTRMLGLDIHPPGQGSPTSQRYMGLVQDGILTRIVRSDHLCTYDCQAHLYLWSRRTDHPGSSRFMQCIEKSPDIVDVTSSANALQLVRSLTV